MTLSYTGDRIQVLEGIEPVRKRPGMCIGSSERGLHHLVYAALDDLLPSHPSITYIHILYLGEGGFCL